MRVGVKAFSVTVALALALGVGGQARADGFDTDPFKDLIPGQRVSSQELEQLLGSGVNDRGSVITHSTHSESASSLSETVESSTSSSFSSVTTSSGVGPPAAGAATRTPGGQVGGQTRLHPPAPASSSPASRSFRSPSGNFLRGSSSTRTTTHVGGGL
jgi:hypothetical protein